MVYSLMVLEAIFSPQEPLKVKLSTKFQGVDFSISENSSAANVLNAIKDCLNTLRSLTHQYSLEKNE